MDQESYSSKLKSHPDKDLRKHLEEVLNHTEELTENISIFEDNEEFKDLAKLIAVSHDFGKASNHFQNYLKGNLEEDEQLARHSLISALFALYLMKKQEYKELDKEFAKLLVFKVIKHHHGNLKDMENKIRTEENQYILKIWKSIKENQKEVEEIYRDLLGIKLDLRDFEDFLIEEVYAEEPYFITSPLTIMEMKKERSKFEFFFFQIMYSILLESDKKSASDIEKVKSDFDPKEEHIQNYKQRFDYENDFNKLREDIYQEIISNLEKKEDKGKFFEIDAPTGTGKTLSMLGVAFKLKEKMRKEGKDPKIIYSLPFISIIKQNYKVFKRVLENSIGDIGDDILMEHHHLADDVYETEESELEYSKSDFLINSWYSEIIVTTFYQLFKSIYTNSNHQLQKTNKLSDSIILIDEIQSVPPDLITPIRDCLRFVTQELGSYVILGTATQPELNKEDETKEKKLNSTKLFSLEDSSISQERINKFLNRYRLNLKYFEEKTILELEEILEESKNLNNFMVVLNTINSTKKLYNLLEDNEELEEFELIYLSTNITPKERSERIEKAKEKIDNGEKFILITTQLIEAGVDISMERIYRDKAPLDKIVQTSGRTNRNNEKDLSDVYVLNLVNEDHNNHSFSSYIYDRILLNKTQRLLQDRGKIEEKELYNDLIPRYFKTILENIAQGIHRDVSGNERELDKEISSLKFEKVDKGFELIKDNLPELTFFIIKNDADEKIWKRYLEISKLPSKTIKQYYDKKEAFSRIKKDFKDRTVNIRVNSLDNKEDIKEHVYRLSQHDMKKECNEVLCIKSNNKYLYQDEIGIKVKDIDSAMIY